MKEKFLKILSGERKAEDVRFKELQNLMREHGYHAPSVLPRFTAEVHNIFNEGALISILGEMWCYYVKLDESEIEIYNQESLASLLWESIKSNDLNALTVLLEAGVKPNNILYFERNPISFAICCNPKDIDIKATIELLHSFGTDIHNAPMSYAASVGNCEAIECLVKLNASVNPANNIVHTSSPLHEAVAGAAKWGSNAIKLLIALRADLYAIDSKGRTPRAYLEWVISDRPVSSLPPLYQEALNLLKDAEKKAQSSVLIELELGRQPSSSSDAAAAASPQDTTLDSEATAQLTGVSEQSGD